MKLASRTIQLLIVFILTYLATAQAQPFSDNFDDGDDNGWIRYNPLQGLGVGGAATWSFTNGAYRLNATAATMPAIYGAARMGSYRTNIYVNFTAQMDVIDWKTNLDELFGVMCRMSEPGLGTTDGYAFVYGPQSGTDGHSGQLQLMRIFDEYGIPLSELDFTLVPGHIYRFVFTGIGANLTGELFDLENPDQPVATLTLYDDTFASGYAGLFISDNSLSGKQTIDFTLDNFSVGPPQPKLELNFNPQTQEVTLTWPNWAEGFTLEESEDLIHWTASPGQSGNSYTTSISEYRFYRLANNSETP